MKKRVIKKSEAGGKMTMEKLAIITQGGFAETHRKIDVVKEELSERIDGVKEELGERIDGVDKRLDRIENLLIRDHDNRLNRLEDDVRVIKTTMERAGLKK